MRVHQPGSHLMRGGKAEVDDWSWAQTRRRLHTLYRLARPYKGRIGIAVASLIGATLVALVPPYLVGRSVDEVSHGSTEKLGWYVVAFVAAGTLGVAFTYAQPSLRGGPVSACSPTSATTSSATCSGCRSASTS